MRSAGKLLEEVYIDVTTYLGVTSYKSGKIEARVSGKDAMRAHARRFGSIMTFHIEDNNPGTLRHELTHILIDKYFSNAPIWFHEGVAQYVEKGKTADIDKISKFPGEISFSRFNNDFDRNNTPEEKRAYKYSYGIISYLIIEYGQDKLKAMFKKAGHFSKHFRNIYGRSLEDFEDEIKKMW